MPETFAAIAAYFSGAGATAATATGAAATGAAATGAAATGAAAGAAASGAAGAAGLGSTILNAAGTALAAGAVGKLLAPGKPDIPSPTRMPDPLEQQEARRKALVEQVSRRGRASTILTADSGGNTLGG